MNDYRTCVQNLVNYSKNANIFVLIHKMDKIADADKAKVLNSPIEGRGLTLL